jgi:hypothetical protein
MIVIVGHIIEIMADCSLCTGSCPNSVCLEVIDQIFHGVDFLSFHFVESNGYVRAASYPLKHFSNISSKYTVLLYIVIESPTVLRFLSSDNDSSISLQGGI